MKHSASAKALLLVSGSAGNAKDALSLPPLCGCILPLAPLKLPFPLPLLVLPDCAAGLFCLLRKHKGVQCALPTPHLQ